MALRRLVDWFGLSASAHRKAGRRPANFRPGLEVFEDRTVPAVSILNNSGNGYAALSFNQSGGDVPPDTCGAAGPSADGQDVNLNTHVSPFDVAVSKTSNPPTLSAADWTFYKLNTTQAGEAADYPGNF